jgi:hypothetical protein
MILEKMGALGWLLRRSLVEGILDGAPSEVVISSGARVPTGSSSCGSVPSCVAV